MAGRDRVYLEIISYFIKQPDPVYWPRIISTLFFKGMPVKYAFFFLSLFSFAVASTAQAQTVATIDSAEGEVVVKLAAGSEFKPAAVGNTLAEADVIRTGRHGRAGIVFEDGFLLRLAENTTLQLKARPGEKGQQLNIDQGKAYFFSREPKELPVIASPAVTTAIRGTELAIEVTSAATTVSLLDGAVECYNDHGRVALRDGEQSTTQLGQAPVKSILLNPADAVQWALTYPVLVDRKETVESLSAGGGYPRSVAPIVASISKGDEIEALRAFEKYKGHSHPALDIYLANTYLSIGQTDKAAALLERADQALEVYKQPDAGRLKAELLAQQAVLALARNERKQAEKLARAAHGADPSSRAASLSNAYIAQAAFDLEGAKSWYKNLLAADPDNAFAYAKLAELELGEGDFRQAEEYLSKALAIAPNDSMVLTFQGFLLLFKDKTEEAREIFEQVINQRSDLALARLGLGLAKIRKGALEEGRQELQRAVYLDPQVAIYRSYLGKAYFEEDNERLAGHEYERAISLDPRDPTAYLYRAYNHLSQNKPVRALRDVEKSIELNNNRAVYRSSLALDQDVAVRSAGLAEVFTSLGFSEVARIEAIKSLNKSYANYSAHRLLADSYNTIFLNDAQVSEQRLAAILSPLSFNLFTQASNAASLNEYNALFDRNETRTQIEGTFDTGDDLLAPGVFTAGRYDKIGYLLGFDGTYTGGSKDNNFSVRNRGRLAIQYQPVFDQRFLLQAHGLYRNRKDDLDTYDETKFEDVDASLAYQKTFSQYSKLIAEAAYSNKRNNYIDDLVERFATVDLNFQGESITEDLTLLVDEFARERIESFRGTLQHIYDSDLVSSVVGAQLYYADQERQEDSLELDDSFELFSEIDYPLRSEGFNDVNGVDYYAYTTWHLTRWMDVNLGTALSEVELDTRELTPFVSDTHTRHKLSPKFGVTLYPTDTTTVRAAYFETLRKSSLEDTGSLEPTLVGGINQRFSDFPGADSRNIGVGIDQKITGSTYFGVEGLRRKKIDRLNIADTLITIDFDEETIDTESYIVEPFENHSRENIARAYLYQVICSSMVATLDYQWSGFEREQDDEADLDTQVNKISGTLRYFDTSRWFTYTTATWREQNRRGNFPEINGNNDFWTIDAGLGYRLPNRHGSVVLQVNNIFDREFLYDQSLGLEPFVRPGVSAGLLFNVNFDLFN